MKTKGYSSVKVLTLSALELTVNINKATGGQLNLKKAQESGIFSMARNQLHNIWFNSWILVVLLIIHGKWSQQIIFCNAATCQFPV